MKQHHLYLLFILTKTKSYLLISSSCSVFVRASSSADFRLRTSPSNSTARSWAETSWSCTPFFSVSAACAIGNHNSKTLMNDFGQIGHAA